MKKIVLPLLCVCMLASCARKSAMSYVLFDNTDIKIYSAAVTDTIQLMAISDTHLYMSDEREDPYRENSARMAAAYNMTRHFKTGEPTNPAEGFDYALSIARKSGVDAIVHLGDLVSYPTEYGIEYAFEKLEATGLPWYYIPGNHDWHYEGMEGTEAELRDEWVGKRLAPLLKGHDPLGYTVDIKGVRLIMLSDGINEILPGQVSFIKDATRDAVPSILLAHIPFYSPGRQARSFTIGNPEWGSAIDVNHVCERRPRWPEEGHGQADYDLYDAVLEASASNNLLAAVFGHVHHFSNTLLGTLPMITIKDNASAGYSLITIMPLPRQER